MADAHLASTINSVAAGLQPVIEPVKQQLLEVASAAADAVAPHVRPWYQTADAYLQGLPPVQVALLAATGTLVITLVAARIAALWQRVRSRGLLQLLFSRLKQLPIIRGLYAKQLAGIRQKIAATLHKQEPVVAVLPAQGKPAAAVMALLKQRESSNIRIASGCSCMSGAVYISDEAHKQMLDEVYSLFSWTNPLHADAFPSVRQMEAEVISMTAAMLHGGPSHPRAPHVCGALTSGGTESILLAVKAARDHARDAYGITEPELIMAPTAHAAFWKASEYFSIKLRMAPLAADQRLHPSAVAKLLSPNTIMVVASAPSFPHGLIDDVGGIAALAARRRVWCHVDACLGGFLLPFAARLGHPIPPFDFQLPGVMSMSVDTHKFGMAHKGTSVVLYRSPELRKHQFTCVTEWPGGLYISPSMAGSRNGALIATAWASLVHLGEQGLLDATRDILAVAQEFKSRLAAEVPEVQVVGQPLAMVVAFNSTNPRRLNIYRLNDLMTARGWHLNALQQPAALHFCFTAQHKQVLPTLLADLKACVAAAVAEKAASANGKAAAAAAEEGSAPVYGLAGVSPDRGLVADFLTLYQDAMLSL